MVGLNLHNQKSGVFSLNLYDSIKFSVSNMLHIS